MGDTTLLEGLPWSWNLLMLGGLLAGCWHCERSCVTAVLTLCRQAVYRDWRELPPERWVTSLWDWAGVPGLPGTPGSGAELRILPETAQLATAPPGGGDRCATLLWGRLAWEPGVRGVEVCDITGVTDRRGGSGWGTECG